CMQALEFPWTC
nr:immunoglobulin light chain junction region [Macaca mulatta]